MASPTGRAAGTETAASGTPPQELLLNAGLGAFSQNTHTISGAPALESTWGAAAELRPLDPEENAFDSLKETDSVGFLLFLGILLILNVCKDGPGDSLGIPDMRVQSL